MFNMFSVVNLFFVGIYNIFAFVAKKSGHEQYAEKFKKQSERCNKKILFHEGMGPWPEKL